MARRFRK